MTEQPLDRDTVLLRMRVALQHEPKPSPLVSYLADYILEKDPKRKSQISRRFYIRLNQAIHTTPVPPFARK